MHTPEVVRSDRYTVGESTSAWQLVDSDIIRKSLHACIASEAYEEKDQYPTEVGTEEADDGQHEASVERQKDTLLVSKHSKAKPDQSSPIALLNKQYSQLLQEMRGGGGKRIEIKDASFIHLLDTGGQSCFQDILPLLLDVPRTYIHVFDAS